MFYLIMGIVVAALVFTGLGFVTVDAGYKDRFGDSVFETNWKLNKRQFLALPCLLLCLFGFITRIPANNVGIVYSSFTGTREETLSEGFHGKNAFDKIYKISTEVQSITVSDLTTQTKDAQFLTSTLDIKYKVSESNAYLVFKQYRTLDAMTEKFISPTTQRILELVTTKYNVIDILGEKRGDIYSELEIALSEEFAKYGIDFYSISIVDMDAGDALEKAIADEAVAKKAVETAEQELLRIETEAQQKSVQAQAEQDAARIKAETKILEADAEKKANELLTESLTEEVLQKKWIEKWNGQMPKYYSGAESDLGLMVDITNE